MSGLRLTLRSRLEERLDFRARLRGGMGDGDCR
jgi:hypothetical protein